MTAWSPLLRRNRCSGTLSRSLSVSQLGHGNAEAQAWRGLSRESTLVPEEPRRPSEERPAAVRASDADRLGPEGRRTARGRTQAQVRFDSVSPGEWKAKERVLGAAAHPALPSVPSERVRPTHRSGVTGCRWLLDPGCAVPREGPQASFFGSHSGCTVLLCDGTSKRERPGASDLWGPATSEFGARWHRLRLHCRGPACGVGATATPLSVHPAALRCPGRGLGRGWRQGPRCGLSPRAPLCHAAWSGVRPHCPLRRPCSWPGGHRGCISFPEERR